MKLKLWCLFLGMGLVSTVVYGETMIAQAENYSLGLIEVAQANSNSESTDSSREAEIEKADRLNQQGIELYKQGKYTEAISIFKQVLGIRKKFYKKDHSDVAISLNNLALLYKSQGRYGEAEPLYSQALAMKKLSLLKTYLSNPCLRFERGYFCSNKKNEF